MTASRQARLSGAKAATSILLVTMITITGLDSARKARAWIGGRALIHALALVLLLCGVCAPAGATEDPPARVGRVSLVTGSTDAIVTAGADWEAVTLNTPVSAGTALRTSLQSRAEVRVGSASLQLNANTQLRIQALDDEALVLVLERGNVALSLRALAAGERVEVHAGEATFLVTAPGSYHFGHAIGANRCEVRVFAGAGNFAAASPPLALTTGQQVQIDTRTLAVLAQGEAIPTRFDEWAAQRARRAERPELERYVSAEMTGAEELDGHGRWRVEPRVGAVWYPNAVDAEWAPYRAGRWLWVAPWGWSWVDQAPWGFAPFHYGRWLFVGGRWGWVPGSFVARPVYAPALVGFYGGAPASAAPWVGWFPLAPGEPYRPGFAASGRYLQNLNAAAPAAPSTAPNSYRYAQTSFAATAMARDAFGSGQPAALARVPLSPATLSAAGVLPTHVAPAPAPAAPAGKSPTVAVAPESPLNAKAASRLGVGAETKNGKQRADVAALERRAARRSPEQAAAAANPKPQPKRLKPQRTEGARHAH